VTTHLLGAILGVRFDSLQGVEDVQAADDAAEDGVLAIQVGAGAECHKKLRLVGVRSTVGHAKDAAPAVREVGLELVLERSAFLEGRLAAPPRAGWVTALDHEVADTAVEARLLVVAAGAVFQEVLACPRHMFAVQLQVEVTHRRREAYVALCLHAGVPVAASGAGGRSSEQGCARQG